MTWNGATAEVIDHTAELNPLDNPIATSIISFGEDENGEVYFLTAAPNGKGISRFVKSK